MTNQEAINILGQYDVSNIHFYTTDGEEIPFTEWSDAIEMAISALQAQEAKHSTESSSTHRALDTISRQEVYDALMAEPLKWDDSSVWESARCYQWMMDMDAIKALPSAQPEPPWIPVSERLPKDGTEVFVYLFDLPSPFIAWIEDTRWYTEDFEVERENKPIAWMPLPEPYRAERRTDERDIPIEIRPLY